MKKLIFASCLFSLLFSLPVLSQTWLEGQLSNKTYKLDQIKEKNEAYWAKKDTIERSKGWKAFKRWEWFWQQRTYPTGSFPQLNELYSSCFDNGKDKSIDKALDQPTWKLIGPINSEGGYYGLGRVNCVRSAGTNENILYAGAASGGIWKTTDGGKIWVPVSENFVSLGVSDIAVQPNNSNVIYVATGDCDGGATYSIGVLKSTNGGQTWQTTGLIFNTSSLKKIYKLVIHPSNYNIIFAAGTNGIDKSTDGGASWTNVNQGTFFDIKFNPGDPTILYSAGLKIYKSTNTGSTWEESSSGLPQTGISRISIGVTPANASNLYVLLSNAEYGFGGFFVSTNGGYSFQNRSNSPNILGWMSTGNDVGGQGIYDLCMAVSQIDENTVYIGGVNIWKSTDGGKAWLIETNWYPVNNVATIHADQHDLYIIPGGTSLFSGNDGGVYKKIEGSSWKWIGSGMPITQFYRIGGSRGDDNLLIAGCQDNGTKLFDNGVFTDVRGGDGMECMIDYSNPDIIYASSYYGSFSRSNDKGKSFTPIKPPGVKASWIAPIQQHSTNPQTIFIGYQEVYKSTNRGETLTPISKFGLTGNQALDILVLAPSDPNIIYTARGAGLFKKSTNGGTDWITLSYPVDLWMSSLLVHPTDPNKIWISFSGYTVGKRVYFSSNGGTDWKNISDSLPGVPINTLVYEKNSPDRIYAGTDIGVYYRDNITNHWIRYSNGLPNVVITDFEIQPSALMIRAASYGRGLWEAELAKTKLMPQVSGNSMACKNETEVYSSNSFAGVYSNWSVTGGKIIGPDNADTVVVEWTGLTNTSIKLIQVLSSTGMRDSVTKNITVNPKPTASVLGKDTICYGVNTVFSSNNNSLKNQWEATDCSLINIDEPNGQVVIQGTKPDATASLKLIQTDTKTGCSDTTIKKIYVRNFEKVNILGEKTACTKTQQKYTATSNKTLINKWDISGGSIIIQDTDSVIVEWTTPGNGYISLTQSTQDKSCRDSLAYSVMIGLTPEFVMAKDTSVCTGSELKLSVINNPDYKYKWTSDNGTILGTDTSSNVNISWDTPGVKNVWLQADSKDGICGLKKNAVITVFPNPAKPTIKRDSLELVSSSPLGNQWYLDNVKMDGETKQTLSPKADGNYTVIVTNSEGCISPVSDAYVFKFSGIEEISESNIIYPNPAHDFIRIKIADINYENAKIEISDIFGKSLEYTTHANRENVIELGINYPPGLYILKLQSGGRVVTAKIVIY